MKKIFLLIILLLTGIQSFAQKQNYVIGFYNVENLFDIYDDPVKDDAEFLPDGKNKWTQTKYEKKLHNIARVINAMRDENGVYHTILGVSEIENRLVLEDLVSLPELVAANYQIVHYDGPDARGVDVAPLQTVSAQPFGCLPDGTDFGMCCGIMTGCYTVHSRCYDFSSSAFTDRRQGN